MRMKFKKGISLLICITIIFTSLNFNVANKVNAADVYDDLRLKYKDMITGGTAYDVNDPVVLDKISSITSTAQSYWDSLVKANNRTTLWTDLNGFQDDNHIREEYIRVLAMARAYATYGSNLYQNTSLKTDIISALDWLYANHFNETITKFGNWYNWEISVPEKLNTIIVLMYDDLSSNQITNHMNAIKHFKPNIWRTGSNRVWECTITVVRGIIIKSSSEINYGKESLSPVFDYVSSSDGFYLDGSFIQHEKYPYQGEYGRLLLNNILTVMEILSGSSFAITDPDSNNVFTWLKDSFAPLIYKGQLMSMVFGRTIAYTGSYSDSRNEHTIGHDVMRSILRASTFAPAQDKALFERMLKYWIANDTYRSFNLSVNLRELSIVNSIMNDTSIVAMDEPLYHKRYTASDRVVHSSNGYALGLSMYSKRIANYESINNENLRGWYTGAGTTYLYNNDLSQYSNDFWATVNPYRLPGTTVDTKVLADQEGANSTNGRNYVGGVDILSRYGITGMQFTDVVTGLEAKKSWFMFDDEIVALGSGITSTSGRTIETIIDNKKINGLNKLTVNGVLKSQSLGFNETMNGVNTLHIEGNTTFGSDIGYYFPTSTTIKGVREQRTGKWYDIYKNGVIDDFRTSNISRNYLTLWQEHGTNPTDATYSYVMLPNKSSNEVIAYKNNPNITILANTKDIQAVKENTLNIVAANFWQDATQTIDIITSNRKASVMTVETSDGIEVSVSDPTQVSGSPTQIEIARSAGRVLSMDSGISVTQLYPTIKFTVNVTGSKGKTFNIKFLYDDYTTTPTDDAFVQDGTYGNTNYGTNSLLTIKSINEESNFKRKSYIRFDFSDYTEGTISSAKLRIYVSDSNTDTVKPIKLYGTQNKIWSESTLTWNNAPNTNLTYLGMINMSEVEGIWYEYDVTEYVKKNTDKIVSFLLINEGAASAKGNISFASKQADAAIRPKLAIIK